MRLIYKLLLLAALPTIMIWLVGVAAIHVGEQSLEKAIERSSADQARAVMDEIDRVMHGRIAEWQAYVRSDLVQRTLAASNDELGKHDDVAKYIADEDRNWTARTESTPTPFMRALLDQPLSNDLRVRVARLQEGHGYALYGEVFLTNRFGANAAQTGRTSDYRQDDELWWQNAMRDGVYITDVTFDDSAGVYSVDICMRIDDANGQVLGVLKAVLNIREVVEIVNARAGTGQSGRLLTLYTRDRRVICRGNSPQKPLEDGQTDFADIDLSTARNVDTVERYDRRSERWMLSSYAVSQGYGRFDSLGWIVLAEESSDRVLAPLHTLRRWLLAVASAATVVAVLVNGGIAWSLAKRLSRLTKATEAISGGQFGAIAAVHGGDEIGVLAQSFNAMSIKLRDYADSLRRANEQLGQKNEELTTYSRHLEQARRTLEMQTQELERQSETLRVAETEAQAASQAKSQFLANMSHEIRTPLTAILGFADTLLSSVTDRDDRDAVETIRRSGQHLLEVLNDILDLSKIEAGKLQTERVACSVCQVVCGVASLMRVRAEAKGLPLLVEFCGPIPKLVYTDPTRLRQVLLNLVGNAIKFTHTGCVRIVTRLVDEPGARPRLRFDVIDTGIGIAPDALSRLFQPFSQADTSTTREYGGTGLGLTISRRLAEMLNGTISVDSAPGHGSTFTLMVELVDGASAEMVDSPTEATAAATSPDESADPEASQRVIHPPRLACRVLLAEDGPDNQRLLAFVLGKAGAEVTLADNGQATVELALSARDKSTPFDVILMDMQMPVLDGYAATRQLRSQGYTGAIIALTANAMSGDRDRCIAAGCDDYTTKPINRPHLLQLVAHYTPQPLAASTTPTADVATSDSIPRDNS